MSTLLRCPDCRPCLLIMAALPEVRPSFCPECNSTALEPYYGPPAAFIPLLERYAEFGLIGWRAEPPTAGQVIAEHQQRAQGEALAERDAERCG